MINLKTYHKRLKKQKNFMCNKIVIIHIYYTQKLFVIYLN